MSVVAFNLFYILFVVCFVYPPTEFVAIGLTLNNLLSRWLVDEDILFVQHHIKRIVFTVIVHSFLPFIYIIIYYLQFGDGDISDNTSTIPITIWNSVILICVLSPICGFLYTYIYWSNKNHPIYMALLKYSNDNTINRIVHDINMECRSSIENFTSKINPISTIKVTQNWIIKITLYNVNFAHQSDTALIAIESDTHNIDPNSTDRIQFVNIEVKPTRTGVNNFLIRLNTMDFKALQDRLLRPITILNGVHFTTSVIELFIEVFKENVAQNPRHKTDQISDSCFACLQAVPNVKLINQHSEPFIDIRGNDINNTELNCGNCYCKPMWCIDCMAKWFASRQNEYQRETWLERKCSCPMCRATFCILDICYVEKI